MFRTLLFLFIALVAMPAFSQLNSQLSITLSNTYKTVAKIGNVVQLMGHLNNVPTTELKDVLLRGEKALGSKCSLKKSTGSSFCQYRLLNYNNTILCFNNDPSYGVIGVTHGYWNSDPIYSKSILDGSTITSSKDYFTNIRNDLAAYTGATDKLLAYIKKNLLHPGNPCDISMSDYQKSASLDLNEANQFKFYKNHLTKEIHCASTTLNSSNWDPASCSYKPSQQFFDPRWCKKIFGFFSTRSTVALDYENTIIPVSQIEYHTLNDKVIKDAAIQHFPPSLGLHLEEASTKVSIFDNLEPAVMAVAEYAPADLEMPLVNDPVFARFYKLVDTAIAVVGSSSIHIPLSFKQAHAKLDSIPTVKNAANLMPIKFDAVPILAAKLQVLRSADEKVAKALNSAGFEYSDVMFGDNISCTEGIMTVSASVP